MPAEDANIIFHVLFFVVCSYQERKAAKTSGNYELGLPEAQGSPKRSEAHTYLHW